MSHIRAIRGRFVGCCRLERAPGRAGLREGDVLLAIDGVPCADVEPAQLWPRLWPAEGTSITLTVLRGDSREQLDVEVRPP